FREVGYSRILKRGLYLEFVELLKQTVFIALLTILWLYIMHESSMLSRLAIGYTFIIDFVLSYSFRNLLKYAITKNLKENAGSRSMIVVCMERKADEFIERIKENNYDFNIQGIIIADKDMKGGSVGDIPIVANTSDAVTYICRSWVDEVFIGKITNDNMPEFCNELKQSCREMGITIHTMLLPIGSDPENYVAERIGGFMVLTQSAAIVTRRDMVIKRLMDIAGGLVGCLLTLVLFIVFAPLIFIASPGPIFFSQKRVGKNGKIFKIYKFRSMYMDAEKRKAELMAQNKVQDGMMFKMDDDPRIIKGVGHFIRDYSIDEFPQFFNVLKGDMSLVGTRPPTLDEWEKYELHHRRRLAIKPGLTGMWQVSGRSEITDFEEIVKLDTKYIDEWSIGLDIRIILKTVLVVLKKDGAQ
ncbi:MAG: sugar transferase, partial [Firmicutes bacterium]|nr:sugar transferase [Bacillota bacterium]